MNYDAVLTIHFCGGLWRAFTFDFFWKMLVTRNSETYSILYFVRFTDLCVRRTRI